MKSADMLAEPVIEVPGGRIKGLTRQDEADMAEQGKRQRFNVSPPVAKCKNSTDFNSETSASCPCLASQQP
jgi:hypothetical protein